MNKHDQNTIKVLEEIIQRIKDQKLTTQNFEVHRPIQAKEWLQNQFHYFEQGDVFNCHLVLRVPERPKLNVVLTDHTKDKGQS